MSPVAHADTSYERPIFFGDGQGDALFGVFTRPTGDPLGVAVVVLAGGGFTGSTHRNRLAVRLCRQLATSGYHSMRFDWHGVGESTGSVRRFSLDEPFVDDLQKAVAWIEAQGIRRFVILGCCFGARTALETARSIAGLEGLVLVSLPVREQGRATEIGLREYLLKALHPEFIRQLSDPGRRRQYARMAKAKLATLLPMRDRSRGLEPQHVVIVDPQVLRSFDVMVERKVPMLLIYGDEDRYGNEFRMAGQLTAAFDGGLDVTIQFLEGEVHSFHRIVAQDQVLRLVTDWAGALALRIS